MKIRKKFYNIGPSFFDHFQNFQIQKKKKKIVKFASME
jgi:hypothetical protein